jgi:hypothetical protein
MAAVLLPGGEAAVRESHNAAGRDGLVPLHGRTARLLKSHDAADGDDAPLPI